VGGAGVLAVAYAHLGRDQEAQAALDKYFQRYLKMWGGGLPLSFEMYFWPFKDPEAAERVADGLLKAGLPGQRSAYYKVSEEHRLGGKEIRSLFFGRTVASWPRLTNLGKEHLENRTTPRMTPGAKMTPAQAGLRAICSAISGKCKCLV
jgi:hypothetical protein